MQNKNRFNIIKADIKSYIKVRSNLFDNDLFADLRNRRICCLTNKFHGRSLIILKFFGYQTVSLHFTN